MSWPYKDDEQAICNIKCHIERNKSFLRIAIENKDLKWQKELEELIKTQENHIFELQAKELP